MEKEELIVFGKYQWRILERCGMGMLILTHEIIEQRDYHNAKESVTWENSEMRSFLNTDFLNRFSASDQGRIQATVNRGSDNPWYSTCGGSDTLDKVFLLSLDDVVRRYFGDSSRLLDNPKTNQRYWFDRKDENNTKRTASLFDSPWWWWTRTPGKNNRVSVYVHGDGNIGIQGNGVSQTSFNTLHPRTKSNEGGVRPAMWITAVG